MPETIQWSFPLTAGTKINPKFMFKWMKKYVIETVLEYSVCATFSFFYSPPLCFLSSLSYTFPVLCVMNQNSLCISTLKLMGKEFFSFYMVYCMYIYACVCVFLCERDRSMNKRKYRERGEDGEG